ncbi:hypothetical protein EV426DRAFT_700769 [Tirmania nivea]|nr:hypothetical protein EV426DRAFT_700769 [Tirmania nivea]
MSAPSNRFPPTSYGYGHVGPTNHSMDMQVLLLLIRELKDVVGSKEAAEAEIHARYQARIEELEEENKKLVQYANDALLIRDAVNTLNSVIYGEPTASDNPYSITEDPDVSPILQQRILNLQATLERVRQRARRKEQESYKRILRLENLAHANIEQMVGAVRRNVEAPIVGVGGAREVVEDEQTEILRGSELNGGNLVSRWN